jgi:hypothetical protein
MKDRMIMPQLGDRVTLSPLGRERLPFEAKRDRTGTVSRRYRDGLITVVWDGIKSEYKYSIDFIWKVPLPEPPVSEPAAPVPVSAQDIREQT